MVKILISDSMSSLAEEVFVNRGIDVDVRTGLTEVELISCINDYEGLAVRSATKVSSAILAEAKNLKVIGRAGIGVDNVDIEAATANGVVVMNTPFGNAITTAEHAIAMIMALARQIPMADLSTQAGKWEKSKFVGVEVTGKTLGIIGCGNIGSIVAERAHGLKMKVIAYDPFLTPEHARDISVEKVTLDKLLQRADFISLHTPLTDQTRGIIDAKALSKTKQGVRIINCARGGLVVEEDLRVALEEGHVAGAALDVFEVEPAKDNSLFGTPNLVCTPHLGASTTEAQVNVALQVAEQMADYLLTGAVANALNMPSVSAEDAPRLKPYMKLAEQLGSFAGQMTESGIKSVRIEYEGHAAELNTKALNAAVLKGLLSPLLEGVNMVSAPVMAGQRGIEVSDVRHDRQSNYQTLIRLIITTENQTRSVEGTLFGEDKPRLVNVKGVPIEAELSSHMLYVNNDDRPGLIGGLGTILGEAGINIGSFHLGRTKPGGDAIALVEVDVEVNVEVLKAVANLPNVVQAKALTFY
ncbi:MAG: phosphoglycerate dehydrogenase [Alphaproteobacteria bacterium]|jgi:D-3-phosphoglycerate dehydrogenase|nr:phosphoglycerate dehydrogenase [Alphaproteobacteria bacterium]PPR14587.1 MAG: D-3-phosphoglycerate dehydrogenase [Alphaproteobacteria bacterium MarineAlpha12_Bin1]|tara:strand:- start:1826 stop:3406 length:1581 start_codon:yes stop_codon:yes gene_type:complete